MQIDFAGPERFALDLADEVLELMELLELLTELTLNKFREAVKTPARYIKLWENLTIEMIGVPPLSPAHRAAVSADPRHPRPAASGCWCTTTASCASSPTTSPALAFDIDSLTPPPEGDLSVAEARALWPDKFLWLHPPLGWFREPRRRFSSASAR